MHFSFSRFSMIFRAIGNPGINYLNSLSASSRTNNASPYSFLFRDAFPFSCRVNANVSAYNSFKQKLNIHNSQKSQCLKWGSILYFFMKWGSILYHFRAHILIPHLLSQSPYFEHFLCLLSFCSNLPIIKFLPTSPYFILTKTSHLSLLGGQVDGFSGLISYQTDRHTDSGDISPTRTCVPYVLLAMV